MEQHRVVMVNNITMDASWNTLSTGSEVATADVSGGSIWLRVSADIRPGSNSQGNFRTALMVLIIFHLVIALS